jgi:SpoVK/Ycf46/Vps4 family AAA+-type ATPase
VFDSAKAIAALRSALAASPDNVQLREHLADMLLASGDAQDAAIQYRHLVDTQAGSNSSRLGLAKALFALGRYDGCAEIVGALQDEPACPPEATLLYARVKALSGDWERAASAYRAAIEGDASLADPTFETSLREHASQEERIPIPAAAELMQPESSDDPGIVEKPAITFADVGGMSDVKQEIRMKLLMPMTHPEVYKAYGKTVGGGLLMYGPPGVGKTYLARATAGESKSAFISVGINDILNMWLGNSERHLHAFFEQARKSAPCVLFFDEIDALGASRTTAGAASRPLVNQFLAELDGVRDSNEGVFVVGATNAPWQLDTAFRRPGRFDRIIFVPPPDLEARADILRVMCQGKPAETIDFAAIAKRTDGFSGADLKAVVDIAIDARLRDAVEQQIIKPMTTRDLSDALAKVKPSTREWFATAKNYAVYSNESGIYDDILKYLRQ